LLTPNDERVFKKENVDIITDIKGVFRDIADYILKSQNILKELIKKEEQ
jgi:hypothetical protein